MKGGGWHGRVGDGSSDASGQEVLGKGAGLSCLGGAADGTETPRLSTDAAQTERGSLFYKRDLNLITTQGVRHYHFQFTQKAVNLREVKECTQGHTVGK